MDSIDLQIVKLLLKNCRITYRDIGEILSLSVNAIYKRVQNMIESGIIRAFTAKPSLIGIRATNILVFGKSEGINLHDISKKLGEHDNIFFVGNAGGNFLYIDGYLRDLSELQGYKEFVSKKAKLKEYDTLIKELPYRDNPEVLTKLDYQILRSLRNDAKRTISDLAKEVDASAKTIRKKIKRMIDYNLVEFSINFAPQTEGTIVSQFHIFLDENKDYYNEFKRISKIYEENILYLQRFTNVPNLLMITALTKSNIETANLYTNLLEENFEKVENHIIYNGFFFETWREKLYLDMLSENE